MKKLVVLFLVVTLLGTGACANIQDDSQRTRAEGSLIGGGAGAAAGAGIGALLGGKKGALIGGILGAGIGGIAGLFVGDHIAKQKQKYASAEDWLNECIAHSKKVNTELAEYNTQLDKELVALDKKSAKLAADLKKKQASKEVLTAEAENIAKRQAQLQETITNVDSEIAMLKEVRKDSDVQQSASAKNLDAEIASLEKRCAALREANTKLAAYSGRIAI